MTIEMAIARLIFAPWFLLLVSIVLLWYPIIWFLWNLSTPKQASINLPSNRVQSTLKNLTCLDH